MRKALVDNATLTALQRLSGEIPVKNKYDLDGDILAMESLLQAVLFFDEVYYLDDYKEEYRQSRSRRFAGMLPLSLSDAERQAFSQLALSETREIVSCVTAGSFSDGDFKPFFQMLRMNIWYVWNMQSSVFYLTQKLLADASSVDIGKYSALAAMIFSELKDKMQSGDIPRRTPALLGSDGNPIVDEQVTAQVRTFFAGLNWLAYRTIYYTAVANQLHLDLFLHPIRQAFQVNYFKKNTPAGAQLFQPLIRALTKTAGGAAAHVYQLVNPHISSWPVPIFSAYISDKSSRSGMDALETAYHIREESMFVEARQKLDTLEQLYIEGQGTRFLREANQIQNELSVQMRKILEKYRVATPQGSPVTSLVSFWDTSCLLTGLPQIGGGDIAGTVSRIHGILPKGGFSALYKSILQDLTSVQALGKFHEQITRNVRYDRGSSYYSMPIQDPAYTRANSWWSRPM